MSKWQEVVRRVAQNDPTVQELRIKGLDGRCHAQFRTTEPGAVAACAPSSCVRVCDA